MVEGLTMMDYDIMMNQVILTTSVIINIAAVITLIITFIKKAKSPSVVQNQRIETLEQTVEDFRLFLDKDKKRIDGIEEGNRVTQKAILALMSHTINGNDDDKLKEARDDLEQYLINR